jgi:transcriptional regulator with XRE-family HTH domain
MKKTRRADQRNVIGRRVRQARLRLNPRVSQEDLAGRLAGQGILLDRSAVSRIESQTRYVMDYEAAAIARALKVPVGWLFGEEHLPK